MIKRHQPDTHRSQRPRSDVEAFLRSLSHDLWEPIRTIRSRINDVVKKKPSPDVLDSLGVLDADISRFGDQLRELRLELRATRASYSEVVDLMERVLQPTLRSYRQSVLSLRQRMASRPVLDNAIAEVQRSSDRLLRQFDGVLGYAKAQGTLRPARFSLYQEVVTVMLQLNTLIKSTKAEVTIVGDVVITADQVKFAQMIQNLIANAIRYARPGVSPKITVTMRDVRALTPITDAVEMKVEDEGQGISEEDLPFVFDMFSRGGNTSQDGERGSGLGLAIVRSIVLAHGGVVWVESELGVGSTFHVVVPKRYESSAKRD